MSGNFILSNMSWKDGGGVEWARQYAEKLNSPLSIEWNTKRAGQDGNLEDHPLIENVDQWIHASYEIGVKPQSIRLPLRLTSDLEQIGAEISSAGGWTDLASYINAPLVRLDFSQDCQFGHAEAQKALQSILNYMADSERNSSIHFTSSLLTVWPLIAEGLDDGALNFIGEHLAEEQETKNPSLQALSVETKIMETEFNAFFSNTANRAAVRYQIISIE